MSEVKSSRVLEETKLNLVTKPIELCPINSFNHLPIAKACIVQVNQKLLFSLF